MKKFLLNGSVIMLFLSLAVGTYSCEQNANQNNNVLPKGVVGISQSGYYGKAGTTYMLTRDITSENSAIFLGKDVTLDLNGNTITYAGDNYEHIPNSGFEEGLKAWDISDAPGAKVVNTADVHTFIGEKIMSLEAGDELVSAYINLPVEGRSYFAMCGVTGRYYQDMEGDLTKDMKVSVYVEDEKGRNEECLNQYGDTTMIGCPIINRSTRLGGGFVFAHLKNLPAGKYRIRVKAETDCLIDQIDIRPAMDVGIGIVGNTHPYGHLDHLYEGIHSAFYDYTKDFSDGTPVSDITKIEGKGTVTIKNGTIKCGTLSIMSWGIQSTAEDVRIILDNVKIITSGINAVTVDVPYATITNCQFEANNPFIINRHGSDFYGVNLRGKTASEVSYSKFYGGQGCLVIKGLDSKIHHNYFRNRQTVTNHYSIMAMGDGTNIFENKFEPEIGSGLEIFRHKNIEIFNNEFTINASPPSCEYHEYYSTVGIRIADYDAEPGSPEGSYGNRIYNNKFLITGKKFDEYPNYIPMTGAFFFSASAGENYIFGNEIIVKHQNPESDADAFAFYIGNSRGGQIYNNKITTNVTPFWIASGYGVAISTKIFNNTIVKAEGVAADFISVKMGSPKQKICVAENVEFRSNEFVGMDFDIDATDQHHIYSVSWTLLINGLDENTDVKIININGQEVVNQRPNKEGKLSVELPEYSVDGKVKDYYSPYTIVVGDTKKVVELKKNSSVIL